MIAKKENVKDGWLTCPYCGKRLLPVRKNTKIQNLSIKCKQCKGEFEIMI